MHLDLIGPFLWLQKLSVGYLRPWKGLSDVASVGSSLKEVILAFPPTLLRVKSRPWHSPFTRQHACIPKPAPSLSNNWYQIYKWHPWCQVFFSFLMKQGPWSLHLLVAILWLTDNICQWVKLGLGEEQLSVIIFLWRLLGCEHPKPNAFVEPP